MARQASLYGEADRGVGGAETEIAAPLHDLEKEAFLEGAGINLQIFGSAFAVVEDVMRLELLDPLGRQIALGCEIVIIILGNAQQRDAIRFQARDCRG